MKERELRKRLLTDPVPEELEARERVWPIVQVAWEGRERVSWAERRARPILALAAATVLVGAAVSPPGRVAAGWLREQVAVEEEQGRPLVRLPAPGRLLVLSPKGSWIVRADGSKRLLGPYEDATWSPRGLFVGVTRGHRLTAVDPKGRIRWSLSRPGLVERPLWAPSGFRIAYRSGGSLRVVAGDGTGDRVLAPKVRGKVGGGAAAWRPGTGHVLAFADTPTLVRIVDVDRDRQLARLRLPTEIRELIWTHDGRQLLVVSWDGRIDVYGLDGTARRLRAPGDLGDFALDPTGKQVAFSVFDGTSGRSRVLLLPLGGGVPRELTSLAGHADEVAWSPNGRWLLITWPEADQWLFLRTSPEGPRIVTVSNVSREFDPGAIGRGDFPLLAGWCC